jgi:hypothetical protein
MPVNSNYVAVVRGFQIPGGNLSYYRASTTGMAGSATFFASVLFKKTNTLNPPTVPPFAEVLWGNIDNTGKGWSIGILNDTVLTATVSDGAPSFKSASFNMAQFMGELILATLAVDAGNLHLYINGTVVVTTALDVSGYTPAAGSNALVGVGNSVGNPANPALTCEIAGVGYGAVTLTQGHIIQMFEAAQDAVDLEGGGALVSGLEIFTNRWTAKDLNQGLGTTPAAIWQPRVPAPQPVGTPPLPNTITLIRQGLPTQVLLEGVSYKNPLWAGNIEAAAGSSGFGGPFAMFFGLTTGIGNVGPDDYPATVAAKTGAGTGRVPFPRLGPTAGGAGAPTLGPIALGIFAQYILPAIGIYKVTFMVHTTERGQLQLELNGADLAPTVATNANPTLGGHPIEQSVYITTTTLNSVLAVVNCSGNATALTITPADGNLTHAASQTLLIEQVA